MDQNNQENKSFNKEKLPSEMTIEELLTQAAHQSIPPFESESAEEKSAIHEEFQWNIHEFPKPKRIEEIEFNWRTGEAPAIRRSESFGSYRSSELHPEAGITELDKHIAIDPEKEKFQDYLDQEYERIRAQRISQSIPFSAVPVMEAAPIAAAEPIAAVVPTQETVDPSSIEETVIEEVSEAPAEPIAPAVSEQKEEKASVEQAFAAFMESAAQDEPPAKRKRAFLPNFLLLLLLLIVLSEASFLVILNLYPDSQAAGVIRTQQETITKEAAQVWDQLTQWINGLTSKTEQTPASDPGNAAEPGQTTDPAPAPAPAEDPGQQEPAAVETKPADPIPMADQAALIASQLGLNQNIKEILANDSLAYQSGKDYGLADLNRSKPLANNIWTGTTDQDAVYYDATLVGTLIRFDSAWIDYVNGVNKEVLELLKPDSPAYRSAAGFSKVGKVKETFLKLEIGEIRQGANGFYVWTKETIQIEEAGKSTTKVYRWIYYLEAVDWQMKVVDYFRF